MSKAKIIPGKGFQYTPQTTIKWADKFNSLLENHSSRNELVSKLIEDGLRHSTGMTEDNGVYLKLQHRFSDEQLSILNTEQGQTILYNVLSMILGSSESSFINKDLFSSKAPKQVEQSTQTLKQQENKQQEVISNKQHEEKPKQPSNALEMFEALADKTEF